MENKAKKNRERFIVMCFVYAMIGWTTEILFTAISGSNVGLRTDWTYWTLMGNTSILMMPVYIIGITIVETLGDYKWFSELKVVWKSLIGGFCVGAVEFFSGMFYFHILNLYPWNYSDKPFNLYGAVCLQNYIFFSLAIPLCIFLTDRVEWYLYRRMQDEDRLVYSLFSIYRKMVTFN